jgi:hypothetical protein
LCQMSCHGCVVCSPLGIALVAASRYRDGIMMPKRLDSEKLTRVPIAFPDELYEWVRETAFRRRVSMAEIVREAVSEYRDRTDPRLDLWGKRNDGGN